IKTAEKRNHRIIILEDFNDNLHNKQSKASIPILQFMHNHNMISHIDYYAITEPTWQRGDRNSQIDDIWTTASLEDFTKEVNNRLNKLNAELKVPITEIKVLDKTWHNLNFAIKQAATQHIPFIYKQSHRFHTFSQTAMNLHQALTHINKILQKLLHMPIPNSIQNIRAEINKLIAKINGLAQYNIAQIDDIDLSIQKSLTLISMVKRHRTAIWQAHNIENNNEHRDTINSFIEKRYSNFTDNTTLMIDSILKRHTDQVELLNLKKGDTVITDPVEIMMEVIHYFERWTA
ncbi:41701_t:CDS:2, partial [Gigaspora margarita]